MSEDSPVKRAANLRPQVADVTESLRRAAAEKAKFILDNREKLIEAWIAETGCKPHECELIEQHFQNGGVRCYVRRRDEKAELDKALDLLSEFFECRETFSEDEGCGECDACRAKEFVHRHRPPTPIPPPMQGPSLEGRSLKQTLEIEGYRIGSMHGDEDDDGSED